MLKIKALSEDNNLLLVNFDCTPKSGDITEEELKEYAELNEFFQDDAYNYQLQLLAKTYLVINTNTEELIAAFSLSNDKIEKNNKLSRVIPNDKRMPYYPAVKIARLAVSSPFQSYGYGAMILNYLANNFASTNNKTGCRFITLDAIPSANHFYKKYNFKEIASYSKKGKCFMAMDLIPFTKKSAVSDK